MINDNDNLNTPETSVTPSRIVERIENFISRFVSFTDSAYTLPIALWAICTYIFPSFDAFPYMVITSDTKRSGKTRLAELIGFICSNPRSFGAMSPSSMFRIIEEVQPTIFFDEAEILSQESAGTMRSVLNMGYRKGSTVPRTIGGQVVEFKTYCPKVFVLIGDVMDTLNDRSIIVRMKRGEPRERFMYEATKEEGSMIREEIAGEIEARKSEIESAFYDFKGIEFLTDRDEEIWTPLFVMASVICSERMHELNRIAVDMATEKTAERRAYRTLAQFESDAQGDEYSIRLLKDLHQVMNGEKSIANDDVMSRLKALETAPWRKFRGDGVTKNNVADMLSRFGVHSRPIRQGKKVNRGYVLADIEKAVKQYQK